MSGSCTAREISSLGVGIEVVVFSQGGGFYSYRDGEQTVTALSLDDRDRISRLPGGYAQLATKADPHKAIGDLERRLTKRTVGLMLGSVSAAVAIAVAVDRLAG